MFPLLIIGIAIAGIVIGRSKKPLVSTRENVGRQVYQLPVSQPKPSPLQLLRVCIRQQKRPTERLVEAAMREAYMAGNHELVEQIAVAYHKMIEPAAAAPSEVPASPPAVPPVAPATGADGSPPAPEPRSYPSPIEGVEDDDWSLFANAMKIHPPEFETDRHVGAFHQRKDRLAQLKLAPGKDEGEQYQAFVKDCLDHMRQKKMIDEHVTSVIQIDGEDHVVSVSGLLGLMKAAGPKNAVVWIMQPENRKSFPNTTEIFKRCNNCF